MGSLHVALCSGGTWVEVSRYSFGGDIGAPFEEASLDCFEECCDTQAAHRLMGELDAVGLGVDGGGKQSQLIWCGAVFRACPLHEYFTEVDERPVLQGYQYQSMKSCLLGRQ